MAFSRQNGGGPGRGYGVRHHGGDASSITKLSAVAVGVVSGLLLGWVVMETADSMWSTGALAGRHLQAQQQRDGGGGGSSLRGAGSLITAEPKAVTLQPAAGGSGVAVAAGGGQQVSTGTVAGGAAGKADAGHLRHAGPKPPGNSIHSLMTSSGSHYQNWQGRIMYGTYKLVQQMPGGEILTGFTRILHRVHEDACMDEIPTFHAQPLHPECDVWCDFPVADRPNAVAQWIASVMKEPSTLKGAWVALLECDYVWMKPLPSPGDAYTTDNPGWQYHFGYIMSQHPDCAHIIKRLYDGGDVNDVPNSGPAPALLRFDDLSTVTKLWEQVTAAIEKDPEAVKVLGWVREMYAWDVAIAKSKVKMLTEDPPRSPLLAQPPADHTMGNASMAHYTWGAVYNDSKHTVWSWDKRVYTEPHHALKPEPIPLPPSPWEPNKWRLQEFFGKMPVPQDIHDTLTAMITQMNKAIATLPDLTDKQAALEARLSAQKAR